MKQDGIYPFIKLADMRDHACRAKEGGMHVLWFSDTLLVYSDDNSMTSFDNMNRELGDLIHALLTSNLAFRGSLACERFYADKDAGIYFGKALLEAYCDAESQDWIGFTLSQSSEKVLGNERIAKLLKSVYKQWDVPVSHRKRPGSVKRHAHLLGCARFEAEKIWILSRLEEMKNFLDREEWECIGAKKRAREKYERTIDFANSIEEYAVN